MEYICIFKNNDDIYAKRIEFIKLNNDGKRTDNGTIESSFHPIYYIALLN